MEFFNLLPTPGQFLNSGLIDYVKATMKLSPREHRSRVDFDVDPITGFFPSRPPAHLEDEYSRWEDALSDAQDTLFLGEDRSEEAISRRADGEAWRQRIQSWPTLSVQPLLSSLRKQQRAHLVLSWLVHFYVHSIPDADHNVPVLIPKTLAIPLTEVSKRLGIAPVLTFADTVLWNWQPIDPSLPLSMDNLRIENLFSGTEAEMNFYRSSIRTELVGSDMLRIFDEYADLRDLSNMTSISKISRDLLRLKSIIGNINESIVSVRGEVDPHVFYWECRPWWVGDANKSSGGGWIYEGVHNSDRMPLDGPSAGQSSVMHALDLFLGVDHKLKYRRSPAPSDNNKKADLGFMERMRLYMPGPHRSYLSHIASYPTPIRDLAQANSALREGYDGCVWELKKLRDAHIRIATLYVVTMSRSTPDASKMCPVAAMMEKMEREEAKTRALGSAGPARGTGGNELSHLLKHGRDATRRTMLKND